MRKDCVRKRSDLTTLSEICEVYTMLLIQRRLAMMQLYITLEVDVAIAGLFWRALVQWPETHHLLLLSCTSQLYTDQERCGGNISIAHKFMTVSELILVGYTFVRYKLNMSWVEFWRSVPAEINWVLSALVILSRTHDDIITIMVEKEECVNFICSLWWK